MGLVRRLDRVDSKVSARDADNRRRADDRQSVVQDGPGSVVKQIITRHTVRVHDRVALRRRSGPCWRSRCDQPLVIEKQATEGRL
jgi:hypothetical protein